MVTPAWGSFQKPNQSKGNEELIDQNEQEFSEEVPGKIEDAKKPQGEKPKWGNFDTPETFQGDPDPTADESTIGYFARNVAANASRLGEQVVGAAGNVEQLGKDILTNIPESGGILGWAISEMVGPERWKQMINGVPGGQNQMFPTSKQAKQVSEKATQGYTSPKTKGEKKFQNFVEDVGSTLITRRPTNLRNIAVNNLGIPFAANTVENVVDYMGLGEDNASKAKGASWLTFSLLGNVNGPQYASQLMNRGRNGIPDTVNFNLPRFQNRLQQVANSPHLLHADPRTELARGRIAAIQEDLANGQQSVRSLMTTYDGVNAAKRNRGMFQMNRNDQTFARHAIDEVRHAVRDEILDAGAAYPQALNDWRGGVQSWAVIHQSRAITNTIEGWAKGPYAKLLTGPAAGLFGVGSYGALKAPIVAAPTAAIVPATYKAAQTAYRVWQDPNLSRYYWGAISAAQRENLPAFLNNYNKLDHALDTVEKKGKGKK